MKLFVGDCAVMVRDAGAYSFVLEKGVDYDFGTVPFVEGVDYEIRDDLNEPCATPSSMALTNPEYGVWRSNGGEHYFRLPSEDHFGWTDWRPTIRVSPSAIWLLELMPPVTFTATLADYCAAKDPCFQWQVSAGLTILAQDGASATIGFDGPRYRDSFDASVSSTRFGSDLVANIHWTNQHIEPRLELAANAPSVVFLNEADAEGNFRTSRYYRASFAVFSNVATNLTMTLAHSGGTGAAFFADAEGGTAAQPCDSVNVNVAAKSTVTTHDFYFRCDSLANGTFTYQCADDGSLSASRTYRVIEPLQKLVSSTRSSDGSIVNPSRLVRGKSAWLEVDVNKGSATFSASEIEWRVVAGPARILGIADGGYRAKVEATAANGTAVIEARFGNNAAIQPRFVLPIVERQEIPVRMYYVKNRKNARPSRFNSFAADLENANDIFAQIGVDFCRISVPLEIGDSTFAILPERDANNPNVVSDKCMSLLTQLTDTNCVSVIYVHGITNGTDVAFSVSDWNAIIVGRGLTSGTTLAHELGHLIGLNDIYARTADSREIELLGYDSPVCGEIFSDRLRDWSLDDGRGFYEKLDTHGTIIENLLMCGIDDSGGCDIPSGNVAGLFEGVTNDTERVFINVGAEGVAIPTMEDEDE